MTEELRVRKWSRGHPACIVIEFTRDVTNAEIEAIPKALMTALHGDARVVELQERPAFLALLDAYDAAWRTFALCDQTTVDDAYDARQAARAALVKCWMAGGALNGLKQENDRSADVE